MRGGRGERQRGLAVGMPCLLGFREDFGAAVFCCRGCGATWAASRLRLRAGLPGGRQRHTAGRYIGRARESTAREVCGLRHATDVDFSFYVHEGA